MSELMKKIEYAFANLEEGKAMQVSGVEGAAEGWLLREKQGVMIAALPSDYKRAFDETFSGICMRTSSRCWTSSSLTDHRCVPILSAEPCQISWRVGVRVWGHNR